MSAEETEKKVDSARSQVLGSIIGQRSPSGKTISALKMSGSFEAPERVSNFPLDPSARIRANTDPPKLIRESLQAQTIAEEENQDEEVTPPILPSDSEDEELLMAKAMALAIENNRDKSIEEIRQLVGAVQQQSSHSKTSQSPAAATTSTAASASTLLIPQRFTNIFSASVTDATNSTGSTVTSITNNNADANKKASAKASIRTFGERARGRFNDILGASQTQSGGSTIAKLVTAAVNGLEDSSSHTADSAVGIHPNSAPSSTTSTSSKDHGRRIPFRHSMKPSPRTPPISPTPTDTPLSTVMGSAETVPQDHSESSVAAAVAATDARQASAFTSTTTLTTVMKPIPIRLSGVAWKRRGGMGKYSTAAWEKRRIELQGSKMFYYRDTDVIPPEEEVSEGVGALSPKDTSDPDDEAVVVTRRTNWFEQATASLVSAVEDPSAPRGYLDLAKEKATVHAAFGHSGAPSPFAISIKVRGETRWKLCFDYHKTQMEWLAAITDVVVQASVDAYNTLLLEAADPANQTEVVGAAAALFPPAAVSEPPAPEDGSAPAGSHRLWMLDQYTVSNGTDLKNQSTSSTDLEVGEEDNPSGKVDREIVNFENQDRVQTIVEDDTMLDHEGVRADALENSSKTWTIPEKNLWYLGAILNFGLAYARASSTTMDGFWYLVAFVNVGAYLCLCREVDWRSLLLHVKAVPGVSSRNVSRVASKSENTTTDTKKSASSVVIAKKPNGYIPVAGCSSVKLNDPSDPPQNDKGEMFAGWRPQLGEILQVRSHGYNDTKKKVSSPGELYDCVGVDIFESPSRYPDMAKRVKLPKIEYADEGVKTWRSPDIFIISIALPTDPPKMGRTSSDGGGYTVTMYFAMKQETRDILRRVTADGYVPTQDNSGDVQKSKVNAVRLLEEWVRRAPTDQKFFSRFKIVPHAHNLKEIGMPNWISRYNGKPFLIKRPGQTGFLYSHPELSCVEFDVSLHPFPYLARQAICFMKDSYFKRVLVTFGFVIEGRSDDELPECLIGAMQLCYPDPAYAIQAEDFFAGTAPRSV